MVNRVDLALKARGMSCENTHFAHSICPDEVNLQRGSLVELLRERWGEAFALGGIGGVPFAGKTGFRTVSGKVPDGDNILLMFGPHLSISEAGELGRDSKRCTCSQEAEHSCAALVEAYEQCRQGHCGSDFEDPADLHANWLRARLAPRAAAIASSPCPLAALAMNAFEVVRDQLEAVLDSRFGSGCLVLIGGVQINMPFGFEEHFVPLVFEVRQEGKPAVDLLEAFESPSTTSIKANAIGNALEVVAS